MQKWAKPLTEGLTRPFTSAAKRPRFCHGTRSAFLCHRGPCSFPAGCLTTAEGEIGIGSTIAVQQQRFFACTTVFSSGADFAQARSGACDMNPKGMRPA